MKALVRATGLLLLVLPALVGLTACGGESEVNQIKAVIEKANREQQNAFAAHNPGLMEDTSTAQNLVAMTNANEQIAADGALEIRLDKIEWGEVKLLSATTASATTWETWETTLQDGQTFSDRERNDYRLLRVGGSWKIDQVIHPEQDNPAPDQNPASSPGRA